jgi:alkanesulfonate monooxygenase SsuD/methylene tetrahydromethanopterin reductase-like flavin-dependent oxidoreductase (luciferase family)
VKAAAKAAGRTDIPKIQVAFRPIIAPTEELAWEKAIDFGRHVIPIVREEVAKRDAAASAA